MKVTLFYKPTMHVHSVSVVGTFLSDLAESIQMEYKENLWECELDLPPGEHLYKFLLNQELPIFDPSNNLYEQDSDGELWSLIIINNEEQRLFSSERYHIYITSYQLSAGLDRKHLKGYSEVIPFQIVATISCERITGVHGVTVAWYAPNETLFEYSENVICAEGDERVYVKFWIDHESAYSKFPSGQWSLKLYVDGVLLIEDYFTILSEGILHNQSAI